jgi:hypothetical protein
MFPRNTIKIIKQAVLLFSLVFFFCTADVLMLTLQNEPTSTEGIALARGGDHGGSGGDAASSDSSDAGGESGDHGGGEAEDGSDSHDSGDSDSDDSGDHDEHDDDGHDDGDHDTNDSDHSDTHDSTDSHDHDVHGDFFSRVSDFFSTVFTLDGHAEHRGHESNVLIVINADQNTMETAVRSSLTVEQQLTLKNLNLKVTRFLVPEGSDETVIRSKLKAGGHEQFKLNHYYQLESSSEDSHIAPEKYPYSMIKWPVPCLNCGLGVKIGMVDSYVDARIPTLSRQQIVRQSFAGSARQTKVDHGTAIAAILTGCHGSDFCGLMPGSTLFAAAAFSEEKSNDSLATALAIARSLDWLIGQKVDIINLSFSGPDDTLLKKAVSRTLTQGIPIIAAAGNHGKNSLPCYPAAYPGVIAVTAADQYQHSWRGANQGQYISFTAPGVQIPIPNRDGSLSHKTGTSYASAYCTALAARLLPRKKQKSTSQFLVGQLKKDAIDLGVPGKDPLFGWGLIQCGRKCREK